ncbi:hypothetical protein HDU98_002614 [Podochytrium sp. JEL0797]|nr:hypothetical protein HDU98_002614 [Podochytrium sp. JEL0797]
MKRTASAAQPADLSNSKRQATPQSSHNGKPTNSSNSNAFSVLMQSQTQRTETLAAEANPLLKTPFQILDRWSKFIGHAVRVTSRKDVTRVQALLKTHADFKSATHNIQAWRFLKLMANRTGDSPDDFVVEDGWDEDGELAAGRKLWIMMRDMGACDCMVIVTRWYGGTQLGQVRFDHINNVGVAALRDGGFIGPTKPVPNPGAANTAVPEPIDLKNWKSQADKERLLRLLKARSASIEGFRKNVANHVALVAENAQTMQNLSGKRSGSVAEVDANDTEDGSEDVRYDEGLLTQSIAEGLVADKTRMLERLKARLALLQERVSAQNAKISDLSLGVFSKKKE